MKKKFVAGIAASTTALSVLAGGTVGAAETKAYTKVIKDYYTVVNGKEETRKVAVVTNPNGGKTIASLVQEKDGEQKDYILEVEDGEYTYAFKDMDKDGELDKYEDWRLTVEQRAKDLADQLVNDTEMVEVVVDKDKKTTVEVPKGITKIAGLMLFSSHEDVSKNGLTDSQKDYLTNSYVRNITDAAGNDVKDAVGWTNAMQAFIEESDFNVPVDFSSDPRSTAGSGDLYSDNVAGGSTDISKWPSNLGLAATFSEEHMYNFAKASSEEYRALGIATALGPQMDLATEPRWLRNGGTFGENSKLSQTMAQAYVDGSQSTYVNGKDVGWGKDSINCMIKHFPGDGAGEGGRESHTIAGKYAVYPGGNYEEFLNPFKASFKLKGKTGSAAAVMTSYSIGIKADGSPLGGERVGSAYSSWKMNLLRKDLGFDGVVCTDWGVTSDAPVELSIGGLGMSWGVENLSINDRHHRILSVGGDMFGGNNDNAPICYSYDKMVKEDGINQAKAVFAKSAERLLTLTLQTGYFENPYLDLDESIARATQPENQKAGYQAQLDSVVLLKNKDQLIKKASQQTKAPKDMTVYIPHSVDDAQTAIFGNSPASVVTPLNLETAKGIYGKVITDEITIEKDKAGNLTKVNVKTPDLSDVDMVIVGMRSPNNGSLFSKAGIQTKDGKSSFYPLSLQWSSYTADGKNVRKTSIAGDIVDGKQQNRSYYGNTSKIANEYDLTAFNNAYEAVKKTGKNIPIVASVNCSGPVILSEIESRCDAILASFSVSDQAIFDIINGKSEPKGLLPMQFPANMDTVEANKEDVAGDLVCYKDAEGNTYDVAYGLNWSGLIDDDRVKTYNPDRPVTDKVKDDNKDQNQDKDQNNDKEQTPDKSEQGKNPQTSDETNILPFAGLASLALITGVGVFLKKKKED